jgi:ABC-type dipeptide/oligopeptide/nickel transport system ATPase subunit
MLVALARRPLLSGFLLLSAICIALAWLFSGPDEANAPSGRASVVRSGSGKSTAKGAVGTPRSLQGLTLDSKSDISADARTPNVRRESIIRMGLGELQEMKQMNIAVFDDAAKRWNAQPRVKEIIARWKEVEETWKTQDDEAKAAVVPQMEAMWKEALGLLREEVEKSAREAAVK